MKRYLLSLSAIMLVTSPHTIAQNFKKQDSILAIWANDMARYSKLPCDTIRKLETDAAWKMVSELKNNNAPINIATGERTYAHDSASLSYILKERIAPELLK